jgi:hypothetical protein
MKRTQEQQDELDARFTKLWNQGLSLDVITARTGMTKGGAIKARARLELEPRRAGARVQA